MSMTQPRAVVAFCGAGGSSKGIHDAGFDVVGFDNWGPAVDTHNANGMKASLHDLSDPALDDLIPSAPLAWFSCPCQPFSAAGDGEGEFDERDGFPWALRIIAARLYPVVVFENVKGLTFKKHRAYFSGILNQLRVLGYDSRFCPRIYDVQHKVLNAADYGVPQTRERCIIVARRDGGRVTWPTVTHTEQVGMFTRPWVTMADALGWGMSERPFFTIPAREADGGPRMDGAGGSGARAALNRERDEGRWILDYRQTNRAGEPIFCDVTNRPSPTVGTMSEGQWIVRATDQRTATGDAHTPTFDPSSRPARVVTETGLRWWLERPATIAGDTRVFQPGGHHQPGEQSENAIRLTIPELAKLQDFPADWTWTGTKTQQARMIGNAVPPTLARVLVEANRP